MKWFLVATLLSLVSFAIMSQDDFESDSTSFDDQSAEMPMSDEMAPTPTPFPSDEDMSFDSGESFDDMDID